MLIGGDPINDGKAVNTDMGVASLECNEDDKDAPADSSTGKQSDTATPSDEENSADETLKVVKNKNDTPTASTQDNRQPNWSFLSFRPTATKKVVKCGQDLGVHECSLEDRSNCLTLWLLTFINPLLKLGSTKVLDEQDIGIPPKQDVAATAYTNTLREWTSTSLKCQTINDKLRQDYEKKLVSCNTDEQRKNMKEPIYQEPSIAASLIKAFGIGKLVLGLIYYIMSALLTFVPVIILNDLLKFIQSGLSVNEYDGLAHPWVEVAALGVVPFLVSLLQTRHNTIYATHCAVFVRTATSTMLYRKALRVSAAGRAKTSTGQVVNMMSNDTTQLQRFLQFVGMTLVAPLQIIIALVLIYFQVRDSVIRLCMFSPNFHRFIFPLTHSYLLYTLGW
jgi:ABC transporter transmembrane region